MPPSPTAYLFSYSPPPHPLQRCPRINCFACHPCAQPARSGGREPTPLPFFRCSSVLRPLSVIRSLCWTAGEMRSTRWRPGGRRYSAPEYVIGRAPVQPYGEATLPSCATPTGICLSRMRRSQRVGKGAYHGAASANRSGASAGVVSCGFSAACRVVAPPPYGSGGFSMGVIRLRIAGQYICLQEALPSIDTVIVPQARGR